MKIDDWKNKVKGEDIEQYDFVDFDNETKVLSKFSEVIGNFLIYFNNLEHELNLAIACIFIDDAVHMGYLVTKELMFRNKIELFNDLYSTSIFYSKKKEVGIKKLKILYKDLTNMNIFRNNIIHADWLTLDKDNYVRTKIITDDEGKMVKGKKIKITPGIIKANINKIESIVNKLDEIQQYL